MPELFTTNRSDFVSHFCSHFNCSEIAKHDGFLRLGHQQVAEILELDHLDVTSEVQVYESALAWIRFDPDVRRQYVAEVMANVRMPMIRMDYLASHVESEPLLQGNAQCRNYIFEAYKYYALKDHSSASVQSARTKPRTSLECFLIVGGTLSTANSVQCFNLRGYGRTSGARMPQIRHRYVIVVRTCNFLFSFFNILNQKYVLQFSVVE